MAIVATKFVFQKPIHKIDELDLIESVGINNYYPEEAEVDVNAEVTTEDVEDNTPEVEEKMKCTWEQCSLKRSPAIQIPTSIKIDPSEWKLEVEQLRHMLKFKFQMTTKTGVCTLTESIITKSSMALNHDKIDYSNMHDRYACPIGKLHSEIEKRLKRLSRVKVNSSDELSRISELDSVKSRMDDLGNGMTISKPLVGIKQSLARLK
ncbi:hypothetical protein BSLG_005673 [Batrachochytrium salamandrivorans]|nr:hypothetical protein BSLG_005673 [Batrachochytrium salamandrivorans]